MRTLRLWCVICLALLPTSNTILARSTPKSVQAPDSLLTERYIRSIYFSMPDSALHLLNEAEASHRMKPFRIDILRCMVYESLGMYALKERYLRRALATDSVEKVPTRKLQILTQLAAVLDRQKQVRGRYTHLFQSYRPGAGAATESKRKRTAVHNRENIRRHAAHG